MNIFDLFRTLSMTGVKLLFVISIFVGNVFTLSYQDYQVLISKYNEYSQDMGQIVERKNKIENISLRVEIIDKIIKNALSDSLFVVKNDKLVDNLLNSVSNQSQMTNQSLRLLISSGFSADRVVNLRDDLKLQKNALSTWDELIYKKYNSFMSPFRPTINKIAWFSTLSLATTIACDIYFNKFSSFYEKARHLQNATSLFATIAIACHILRK